MVYGILFFFIFSRRIFNIPPRFPLCIYLPFFSFACTLVSITAVVTMLELHRDSASHVTLVSNKP